MSDYERPPISFLSRTPFAIAGAIGLLSLADGLVEFQEHLQTWICAYRWVGDTIWPFLFGWLWKITGWQLNEFGQDYFTMGLIVAGATYRMHGLGVTVERKWLHKHSPRTLRRVVLLFRASSILFWPIPFLYSSYKIAMGLIRKWDDEMLSVPPPPKIPPKEITWKVVSGKDDPQFLDRFLYRKESHKHQREFKQYRQYYVFYETFVFAAIIIAINHAALATGL